MLRDPYLDISIYGGLRLLQEFVHRLKLEFDYYKCKIVSSKQPASFLTNLLNHHISDKSAD